MSEKDNPIITDLMRKSTRKAHSISDKLINAKLAFAMTNDAVWAEGLLIFYEIFKFLEQAIKNTTNEHLRKFNIPEIMRTSSFEKDLDYYLGKSWKQDYIPRKSVRRYLNYLGKLERNEPELLIAYVYHLYLGLLSGGQILSKKRSIANACRMGNRAEGYAVTEFSISISELKKQIKNTTNGVCSEINAEMCDKIIKEGCMVFTLNNEIVRTVQGMNMVILKKTILASVIFLLSYYVTKFIFR